MRCVFNNSLNKCPPVNSPLIPEPLGLRLFICLNTWTSHISQVDVSLLSTKAAAAVVSIPAKPILTRNFPNHVNVVHSSSYYRYTYAHYPIHRVLVRRVGEIALANNNQ